MTDGTKRAIRIFAYSLAALIAIAGLFVVAIMIFFAMAFSSYGSNK